MIDIPDPSWKRNAGWEFDLRPRAKRTETQRRDDDNFHDEASGIEELKKAESEQEKSE